MSVAGFYRFTPVSHPDALARELRRALAGLVGTVLVAGEGINGVLAGTAESVDDAIEFLRGLGFVDRHLRRTAAMAAPFQRLLVRVRSEIVTFDPEVRVDPERGKHLEPAAFEALIREPGVRLIDTRNRYEVRLGHFRGAEDPGIRTFRDFKGYVETALDPQRDERIAIYCTGGIRCEKAAAWMQARGFGEVTQLDGGILGFLEERMHSPAWQGDCFVFDRRIALDRSRMVGDWVMCHGCRAPVSAGEQRDPRYEAGVSCPHCADGLSDERRRRLRGRFAFRRDRAAFS